MEFRPCIDIHDGKVKQIVGATLNDSGASENFISEVNADYYALKYKKDGLRGGHIIMLNKVGTSEYEESRKQALAALGAWRGGMQIGGGITDQNAASFLEAGASHVIVTSFVFRDGRIDYERLEALVAAVGKEHIVLDLSCKKKEDGYYIVTDRWQKFTDVKLTVDTLKHLEQYADEFLIHAADVEGKQNGICEEVAGLLGAYEGIAVTYAGGVRNLEDLKLLKAIGRDRINVTIGSALDLFGGPLSYEKVLQVTGGEA